MDVGYYSLDTILAYAVMHSALTMVDAQALTELRRGIATENNQ